MKLKFKSFTLIELLVVVAIIAVLVAILLPALSNARETANKTLCAGNLHQLQIALEYYAQDYIVWPWCWDNDKWTGWFVKLDQLYLKNRDFLWCPSERGKGYRLKYGPPLNISYAISYCWNDWMNYRNPEKILNPSRLWVISEVTWNYKWMVFCGGDLVSKIYGFYLRPMHFGGANMLFVDGHIEWWTEDMIYPGCKLLDHE